MEQWERPGWRDGFQMPGRPDSTAPVPVNPFPAMRPDGGSYQDTYPTPTPSSRPDECGRDKPWPERNRRCFEACKHTYIYHAIEDGDLPLPELNLRELARNLGAPHSDGYCDRLRQIINLKLLTLRSRRDFYNCMTTCLGVQPVLPEGVQGPDAATPEERDWEQRHSREIYKNLQNVHRLIRQYDSQCNRYRAVPPGRNPQWRAN